MKYVLVVHYEGVLATIDAADITEWAGQQCDERGNASLLALELDDALVQILNQREHDPVSTETEGRDNG